MKKLFSHIHILLIALGTLFIVSCEDSLYSSKGGYDGKVGLKLALSLPGGGAATRAEGAATRAGGTGATTGTEPGTDYENLIERTDIRLLIFQNGAFQEEISQLKITGSGGAYYLEGVTAGDYEGDIETVVFANAASRSVKPETSAFTGKTIAEVYQLFQFNYGDAEWTVDEDHRIPMWGSTKLNVTKGQQNNGYVNMYRAIAKVGFTVGSGKGLDNFTLQSVRMYFSETQGYCAPLPENIPNNETTEILTPSVPASSTQMNVANPLVYTVGGANIYEDKIYLPEARNKNSAINNVNPEARNANSGTDRKPVCIVVGGYYSGEGLVEGANTESYYRIDFKDDLESNNPNDLRAYDLLRNHSYGIDILSVSNPGTPTPEDALENVVVGLTVAINAWENVPMRGIPDQYTLTTSTSILSFGDLSASGDLTVTTDYGMDLGDPKNGEWTIVESSGTWFTATKDGDNRTIHITANQNYGVMREGYFYVQSGNLKKKIIITQQQPPTANCYVVGEGTHKLIVTIKGNGDKGLVAEGTTLDADASIKPASIGIIWETQAGLVKLINAGGKPVGGDNKATYDETTGTIDYVVKVNGANIAGVAGGNALIGAFDANGTVLWSWHIWVRPDLTNNNLASYDENWTLNGYHVMDRNLGALNNKPGVASLGLLYQWGRKDPFIGADKTNDLSPKRLHTENYFSKSWKVENRGSKNTTIAFTIANPTTLTYDGLSSEETTKGGYLWGSNQGLSATVKDLGTKTIYDPCPYGYRVPPVDAFVFVKKEKEAVSGNSYQIILKRGENRTLNPPVFVDNILYKMQVTITGTKWNSTTFNITEAHYETKVTKTSETSNWNDNLIYIPHKASSWNGSYYTGKYVKDATYYGFYLNYQDLKEPTLKSGHTTDNEVHYDLADYTNLTWLPLSGAYDPHVNSELKFDNVEITQGSSLTVNSFLWTNSSVVASGQTRPAAMFLHGTEVESSINGRHIHALRGTSSTDKIIAKPHQAGAVRCVRDTKKDFSESNYLEAKVTIGRNAGSTATATLKSINDSWRVIDSGAYWVSVSPEQGGPDKGKGQTLTFKALETNNAGGSRTATVLIQFGNEAKPRTIVVTQSRN